MDPRLRTWLVVGLLAAALIGMLVWFDKQEQAEEVARTAQNRAHRAEREAQREDRWARIRAQSEELMPDLLDGVVLGMPVEEARVARPRMTESAAEEREPGLVNFEERLQNGGRVHYIFEEETQLLQRVQVLSMLPRATAIVPHLTAMTETYGPPTGIWDCPDTGGLPTRRFTWRGEDVALMDVFLIVDGNVSLTLYLAPNHVIAQSLSRSLCRPITREQLETFPMTDRAHVEATAPPLRF